MGTTGIAVIGMSVRYPDADGVAEFRANLRAGRDSVRRPPAGRMAATGMDPAAGYPAMGYLAEIDRFDHAYFGLSQREAELLDPQHRLAQRLTKAVFDDAGYAASWFRPRRTAVIFSSPSPHYEQLVTERSTLAMGGSWPGGLPARIAHRFGLTGPCFGVDTGCNGSLVAVYHARRELLAGDVEYALVGGVNIYAAPPTEEQLGTVFPETASKEGRCRAFDEAADGTVGGEGGAVLLLTTIDRAVADGAHIYATITGTSVLHNGHHAVTISTPSARAQAEAIEHAWRDAGLDFSAADYTETHGSGTRLGDAVEIEGLTLARAGAGESLPIGSVKTNVGHLDNAAGITGLIKTILSVQHGELYPSLHFGRPARGVDLDSAGLRVVTSTQPWPARTNAPRRAGVSSFSFGGLNAHCVVEQAPEAVEPMYSTGPALVGVSARNPLALRRLCLRLAGELRSSPAPLADVAFTLNEGRDHHEHRIAVLADSISELVVALEEHALRDVVEDRPEPPRVVVAMAGDAVVTADGPPPALPAGLSLPSNAAWQLTMYTALADVVPVGGILASGRSRQVAGWVQGDVTTAGDEPVDPVKLAAAMDQLTAAGPVLVVELGLGGDIGTVLSEQDTIVLAAPEDMARMVGRLYELGVDIDWAVLRQGSGRRLSLPGHPLDEVRCWVEGRQQTAPPPAPAPAKPVERTVADEVRAIFRDQLAGDVHADADFFELGGNSVIALQVIKEIATRFGVEPKMADIYEWRTVPELAAHIERLRAGAAPGELPPVLPGDELLLSFGQERMWFHHQLEPGTTLYNLSSRMRVTGPFDPDAWRDALADFAVRHETIRSNFVDEGGEPRLVIRPDGGDFYRFADLSDQDDLTAAEQLIAEHIARPFDLATDPLYRVLVIRFGAENHLLVNSMHHAVNDGHAPTILRDELPELYTARLEGRPHRLTPLPIQYRDYARWQRELVDGTALADQVAFWQRTLQDAPVLNLPTDLPRPPRMNYRGGHIEFRIPADVVRRVRTLAQQESTTAFVVLLAGLNALLSRMSGQHDISVGVPTAGRTRPELWDLLGFFNNTVVFRTDMSGSPDFRDMVRRVRQVVLDGMDNEDLPFDAVVRSVAPQRDASRNALFDVLFTHQALPPMDELENGPPSIKLEYGGDLGLAGVQTGTAICDLAFTTLERPGDSSVEGFIEYRTQLYYQDTVVGIADAFVDLLRELLDVPHEWRLTRLFEEQAAATPSRTALVCDGRSLTFGDLNARANRLAHLLAARGIGPEDLVALALPRTPDMVVAQLATLKAGAAFVPIDPDLPSRRAAWLISDTDPRLVITPDFLHSEETVAALDQCSSEDLIGVPLSPSHPAYVMYTSGSTGTPKGVVGTHQALANLFQFRQRSLYPSGEQLKAASVASFSFDGSLDGLLWMVAGHETHVITDPKRRDVEALAAYIAAARIDYLDITPSYCRELVDAGLLAADRHRPRLLVLAGEAVPESLWDRLRSVPGVESYNCYGPTECTVDSTVQRIKDATQPVLGAPLDGLQVHVLDAGLRPSAEGELYIAGAALARGYLHRPGLTSERFVADPFGAPGTRMYRTGDLVRRTEEGALVFLGRVDDQVQLRGFRIEPGEIEAVLQRHKSVGQAVVVVRDERLIAHVTGAADPAELRGYLSEHLPQHMIPAVRMVDRLPLTVNGKVDREALSDGQRPEPEVDRAVSAHGHPAVDLAASVGGHPTESAPDQQTDPSEAGDSRVDIVRGLFAELLGLPSVRADEDFFDLGGHSLLAARLAGRIRQRFGGDVTVATLFDSATPDKLVARLGGKQNGIALDTLLPLRAKGDRHPLFCIHPGGGVGWVYSGLVSRLDQDRPIYALQADGLDGSGSMARSVTEMAADYRGRIQMVQQQGPYHLIGWSFGGVVAHEIANQLRRDGKEVGLLAMMDSYLLPDDYEEPPLDEQELRAALGERTETLTDDQITAIGRIMTNNGELASQHRPAKFDGDVMFFMAAETIGDVTCWDPVVGGGIEVHEVPCGHQEMADPHALDHIGPLLDARLKKAR